MLVAGAPVPRLHVKTLPCRSVDSHPELAPDLRTLSEVSEDELLADLFPMLRASAVQVLGPGDDAAVLATGARTVATTDAMVLGPDWRDDWSTATDLGVKAVTQNLADVAAMGARPTALLATLVAGGDTHVAWVRELTASLAAEASAHEVSLVGGDLSSAGPGVRMVSLTALGDLDGRDPVRRDGARPGDVLAVAGTLGRSHAGLLLLQGGVGEGGRVPPSTQAAEAIAHHRAPRAPIEQGAIAADAGANSMIDLSDGLARDAHRLARASGVRLDILRDAMELDALHAAAAVGWDRAWECVLSGGEEHSLLATFPSQREVPTGWRIIGVVTDGEGVALDDEPLAPRGWDHFGG